MKRQVLQQAAHECRGAGGCGERAGDVGIRLHPVVHLTGGGATADGHGRLHADQSISNGSDIAQREWVLLLRHHLAGAGVGVGELHEAEFEPSKRS